MKARWSRGALLAASAMAFTYAGLRCPLKAWLKVWVRHSTLDDANAQQRTAIFITDALTSLYLLAIVAILGQRIWNHYFEAQVSVKIGVAKWKQMLDSELVTEDCSWYLAKMNTLGSPQYVFKCTLLICAFIFFFHCIIGYIFHAAFDVITALLMLWLLAMFIMFVCKYPNFEDKLFLRYEARVAVAMIVTYLLLWALTVVIPVEECNNCTGFLVLTVTRQLIDACAVVALQFLASNLVIHKFMKPHIDMCYGGLPLVFSKNNRHLYDRSLIRSQLGMRVLGSNSLTVPGSPSVSHSGTNTLAITRMANTRIGDVLRNTEGFSRFMAHLFQELCYENLLCLVECTKFRELMIEIENEEAKRCEGKKESAAASSLFDTRFEIVVDSDENMSGNEETQEEKESGDCGSVVGSSEKLAKKKKKKRKKQFPEDVMKTRSTIVEQLNTDTPLAVARLLADKYVRDTAALCVNLSYRCRFHLIETIESDDCIVDHSLFDSVIAQCAALLNDSFRRFASTPQFTSLHV